MRRRVGRRRLRGVDGRGGGGWRGRGLHCSSNFGPMRGQFIEMAPGAQFEFAGEFTSAFASGERGLHFYQSAEPNNHVGINEELLFPARRVCFNHKQRSYGGGIPKSHRPSRRSSRIASVRRALHSAFGRARKALASKFPRLRGGTTRPSATRERTCSFIRSCSSG